MSSRFSLTFQQVKVVDIVRFDVAHLRIRSDGRRSLADQVARHAARVLLPERAVQRATRAPSARPHRLGAHRRAQDLARPLASNLRTYNQHHQQTL